MDIRISKSLASYLGEEKLRTVGIEWNARSYQDYYTLDLSNLTTSQIKELRVWLDETVKLKVRGGKVLVRDIDVWLKAMTDAGSLHARTVNQFSSLLTEYLRKVTGHRIYERRDDEGAAHVAYYVNEIEYHPEQRYNDRWQPAYTEMELLHFELGGRVGKSITFYSEDILGKTASEALAYKGFFVESTDLRKAYLQEVKRFNEVAPLIGKQYLATGTGTDDLDGNGSEHRWSRYSGKKVYA